MPTSPLFEPRFYAFRHGIFLSTAQVAAFTSWTQSAVPFPLRHRFREKERMTEVARFAPSCYRGSIDCKQSREYLV